MECIALNTSLGLIPDFSALDFTEKCLVGHNPASPSTFRPGAKTSTLNVSRSAENGCPWCGILWEAVKRLNSVETPKDQDFLFWRFKGESFFEPWCSVQESMSRLGTFKMQIYTLPYGAYPDSICWVPNFPDKNLLEDSTKSTNTINRIVQWKEKCAAEHNHCSPTASEVHRLPSRVIDVGDSTPNSVIRLVETEGNQGQYLCLSHCWGKEPMPIKTTKDTIKEKMKPIPEDTLPLTFRHAVMLTRTLGCRYLWIDSLCIVQDDEDDWQVQAAQMASIYRNALLTLAATAATGPKDGLFYSARPELRNQKPLELGRFNVPFPVYTRPHMRYDVGHLMHGQEHSLLERGWVLQERLLSPRVVYFGANEVAWECMTCTACECEPQMLPHVVGTYSPREPFNPKAAFSQSVNRLRSNTATEIEEQLPELWHHIVNAYTGLQLTYPKDKFSALSGLVTEIERVRPGDVYLAGLWRNTFMLDILWRRQRINDWHSSAFDEHYDVENVMGSDSSLNEFQKQFKQREHRSERTARTHREYLAPTWSWACVHTQIEYDKEINSRSLHLIDPEFAKLLSVCCIAKYKNPKGELQSDSSYAVLRGKIAQVELKGVKIEDYKLYRNGQALTFSDPDYNLISPTGSRTKLHNGSTLYCFRIATGVKKSNQKMGNVYGLVLHAKENGGEPATEYERVGMFQYVHTIGKEWSVFDGIKEEVNVKIV